MKLIEPISEDLKQKIERHLPPGEEELIRVSTDMLEDGTFGNQWVVVTRERVLVVPSNGEDGVANLPVRDLQAARTEALVGGSQLEIERKTEPTIRVTYSSSLGPKFSEVARGIEQLRQGKPFQINPELDRTRCEKCGRLLPEKNGICPACIHRLATLGRIAVYLKPYKSLAVILAVASILTTVFELIPPLITRRIVDEVLVPKAGPVLGGEDRVWLLGVLVLGLVGVRLLTWGAEWMHGWTNTWLTSRVTADIRSQLYKRLELLSLQFYDKRQVGALMSRVTRDSGRLQDFLVDGLPYLFINGLMFIGILFALFLMSWKLTLYVLVPIPLILVWGMVFLKRMRRLFNRWMQAWSDAMSRVNESLTGIRVVKAFAQENREIEVFGKYNSDITRIAVRTEINRAVFFTTMTFLVGLGVLVVWLFGGWEVIEGEMTLGTLLAFYSYMWLLYGPLEWFGMVNSWMTHAFAGAERIFEIIDAPPEGYEDPDSLPLSDIKKGIRFRDVTFGYDKSKPVLHDIHLNVAAGEMIGLVGKSGVGKTTMVNLICRFYDVDHGEIEIDGQDIRKIRLKDLRGRIGIVPQEPFLFSGTIAENISYGRPGVNFDEIVGAAKSANAHAFIVAKPDGYDSQVGERGGQLSGGERQRIAIARAILHDPKVLVLDEATSSVDTATEKQIQEAIGRLVKGRTTFAIAHRLSTLRNAQRLVMLDGGRIVEMGTHEALMEKRGAFYNLVMLQREMSEMIAVKE